MSMLKLGLLSVSGSKKGVHTSTISAVELVWPSPQSGYNTIQVKCECDAIQIVCVVGRVRIEGVVLDCMRGNPEKPKTRPPTGHGLKLFLSFPFNHCRFIHVSRVHMDGGDTHMDEGRKFISSVPGLVLPEVRCRKDAKSKRWGHALSTK